VAAVGRAEAEDQAARRGGRSLKGGSRRRRRGGVPDRHAVLPRRNPCTCARARMRRRRSGAEPRDRCSHWHASSAAAVGREEQQRWALRGLYNDFTCLLYPLQIDKIRRALTEFVTVCEGARAKGGRQVGLDI